MKNKLWLARAGVWTVPVILALTLGCEPASKPSANSHDMAAASPRDQFSPTGSMTGTGVESGATTDTEEHSHKGGQHGGIIVSLGSDSYHVEAVVAGDGNIRLFTLGKDETRVIDVESQSLTAFAKAEGDAQAQELSFEPAPQAGDAANRTSVFIGKLPEALIGKSLDVTIPNIRIDGERFRLGFRTVPADNVGHADHAESSGMPDKVSKDTEAELYLTPGGHYTAADIAANGNKTASQKFKGIKSEHNMKPKAGDMLCPISGTKANAKFTWIIGGKPYQFCCPPCIDEFLTNAKTSQDALPDPDSFLKK